MAISDIAGFRHLYHLMVVDDPKLFRDEFDPPATDAEIASVENALWIALTPLQKAFFKQFGGGYCGTIDINSVYEGGDDDIISCLKDFPPALSGTFLSVSGDFTDGTYGCRVPIESGDIFYLDELDAVSRTEFRNILESIAENARSS